MLKNKKSFQITKKRTSKRVENNSSNKLKLETNQIILSGRHSILSALKNKNRKLYYLLLTEESSLFWKEQIKVLNLSLVIKIRTKDELDLMNNYQPHQNSILVTEPLDRISLDEYLFTSKQSSDLPQRIIILDQVTDPQNVGAIIRSAYAFNMDGVALSQSNSPSETSSMAKASSGAIEKIKIIQLSNMSREIKKLQAANFSGIVGSKVTQEWDPSLDNAANQKFVSDFKAKYGTYPSFYAAQSYDTIRMIAAAVEKVDGDMSDMDGIRAALKSADYDSVRGSYSYGSNNFPVQNFYLREVVVDGDGNWTTKVVDTVLTNHVDPHASDCKMK